MNKLNKVVRVLARIAEVCTWVLCGFMVAGIIVTAIGRMDWLKHLVDFGLSAEGGLPEVEAFGFSVQAGAEAVRAALLVFFINTLLCGGLMAMVYRNIHLIFKTTAGETRFAKGATPFQPDNIRMVREIGIFMLAMPVIQVLVSTVARLVAPAVEVGAGSSGIFMGLVVLCLSQYFAYGASLQADTDGLI